MKRTEKKRWGELIVTSGSMLIVAYVVYVGLQLVREPGRMPPTWLIGVAVLGLLGAIASLYSVEDIKALRELLP